MFLLTTFLPLFLLQLVDCQILKIPGIKSKPPPGCPKYECTGLDCVTVVEAGCKICACPIGSPARGCDRMPRTYWLELMFEGCPNILHPDGPRKPAQRIHRFYRHINRQKGIDECRDYVFPYCEKIDYNFWRSPRSQNECHFFCYSADELKSKDLI